MLLSAILTSTERVNSYFSGIRSCGFFLISSPTLIGHCENFSMSFSWNKCRPYLGIFLAVTCKDHPRPALAVLVPEDGRVAE